MKLADYTYIMSINYLYPLFKKNQHSNYIPSNSMVKLSE